MDKHEHVITLAMGTKDRIDQIILAYKISIAKDILFKRFNVGMIDSITYDKELTSLCSFLKLGGK